MEKETDQQKIERLEKENEEITRLHDIRCKQVSESVERELAWRAFRGAVEGMPKGWGIDFSSDSRAAYALWMEERDAALLLAPKEE